MAVDTQPGISEKAKARDAKEARGAGAQPVPRLRVVAGQPSRSNRLDAGSAASGDRLRTARGIALGLAISLVGWCFIALLWWLLR